jgi:hypothetical protein
MARRTRVLFVDDLDGNELPDGQGQTVTFSLDGVSYEIDLSKDNADQLREDFKRYTQAGRRLGRQSAGRRTTARRREDTSAIRAWAKSNGHEVNERGRIPAAVTEAYDAAN